MNAKTAHNATMVKDLGLKTQAGIARSVTSNRTPVRDAVKIGKKPNTDTDAQIVTTSQWRLRKQE